MRPDTIPPPPPMPGSIYSRHDARPIGCPKTASRFTITKGKVRERLTHFHILYASKRERNKEKGLPQSGFAFFGFHRKRLRRLPHCFTLEVVMRPDTIPPPPSMPGSIQPTRCPTHPHPPSNKPRRIILLYPFLFSQIPYCQSLLKMVISAISFFPNLLITNYR